MGEEVEEDMNHEQLLSSLVEIKSYSKEEAPITKFIRGWFKERGIDSFNQDGNLVVHLEGKDRSRAFVMNSHMDTVSAGEISQWTYGPWTPTLKNERLIGLGTSDMKSGLAASMLLAETFSSKNLPPIDLWFTYVTKEEIDGSGTESFAKWFAQNKYTQNYREIAAIFTEPTGLKEIEHGHRGNLFILIETHGDSGDASKPELIKTHAVHEMFAIAKALNKEFAKWQEVYHESSFSPPTIGDFTSIYAGVRPKIESKKITGVEVESPNKFPSSCFATFDVRTTPKFHSVALEKIEHVVNKFNAKLSLAFPAAPAGYTDPKDKIVYLSRIALGKARLTVSQGSADLGFLTAHGIKAVIFGPGEKNQAHRVNEYAYPKQIPLAVDIYKTVIENWSK